MQIILRERVEDLGEVGQVVEVRPGYARNYLIPRGYAFEATAANLKQIERDRNRTDRNAAEALQRARARAAELEGVSLTFNMRAGGEGKLFGSITSGDIAEQLAAQGKQVDRRSIDLDEPIKALGVFTVPIRLHAEVRPEIKVWVIREE